MFCRLVGGFSILVLVVVVGFAGLLIKVRGCRHRDGVFLSVGNLSLAFQTRVFFLDQGALDQRVFDLFRFALVGAVGEVGWADLEAFFSFFALASVDQGGGGMFALFGHGRLYYDQRPVVVVVVVFVRRKSCRFRLL